MNGRRLPKNKRHLLHHGDMIGIISEKTRNWIELGYVYIEIDKIVSDEIVFINFFVIQLFNTAT